MSLIQDFTNVFGKSPISFIKRISKGLSVFKMMMLGRDSASAQMPLRLQIEITDKCNFDCIMCNRLTRKNINYELNNDILYNKFKEIIEDINPFYITLNGLGEPLLNKDVGKILELCNNKGITSSMPCNMSVSSVLNDKILKNPPSILQFSIHGGSKKIFEKISKKSNFEQCIEALELFLDKYNASITDVRVLCALQLENLENYENMYKLMKKLNLLDRFCLVSAYDYGDDSTHRIIPPEAIKQKVIKQINTELLKNIDNSQKEFYKNWQKVISEIKLNDMNAEKSEAPCLIPWFSTYIAANGDVFPCCYLHGEEHIMGNINEIPFTELWNGKKYKAFRNTLRENRAKLPGCSYCQRNDLSRINAFKFLFKHKSLWNK